MNHTTHCGIIRLVAPVLVLAGLLLPAHEAEARTGYPKVLNYHLSNDVTPQDIVELARWDALVLDADFPYQNPGVLPQLRSLNPDIRIFVYIPINGTNPEGYLRPPGTVLHQYWAGIDAGNFWLRDVNGDPINDWVDKWGTNLTPNSPVNAQGQQYWEWFANFVADVVWPMGGGEWDGLFLDDLWDSVSFLNAIHPYPIDSDQNGIADDNAQLDIWWRQSTRDCVNLIRTRLGTDVPISGNGENTLYDLCSGTMIENFPYSGPVDQGNPYGYSWNRWMFISNGAYFVGLDNYSGTTWPMMTANANWPYGTVEVPDRSGRFEGHKRFTLGSVLLGDGYYSLDYSTEAHGSIWWEPEYDRYIGTPEGPAYSYTVDGQIIWRRDYTDGSVVVNPNNGPITPQAGLPAIAGWDAFIGDRINDPPPPDTIPPAEISAYWGWPIDGSTAFLKWKAVGDDGLGGRANSYQVRYSTTPPTTEAAWATMTDVPNSLVPEWAGTWETLEIGGLQPETAYHFKVRAVDEAGNVGAFGQYYFRITTLEAVIPTDVTPPAAITTLTTVDVQNEALRLQWTATGDDGTSGSAVTHSGRMGTSPITDANWDSATLIPNLPNPFPAGGVHSLWVTALQPATTYYFALKATDEAGNVSPLGNVLSVTTSAPPPPDANPPAQITDLTIAETGPDWLRLTWTAPADAEGNVALYRLKMLEGADFPEEMWFPATSQVVPLPGTPGTLETTTVPNLTPGTTYTFRIRAEDDSANASQISPAVTGTAGGSPPPPTDTVGPVAVNDLRIDAVGETWIRVAFTAPADAAGTVASYDLRYRAGTTFASTQWAGATGISTTTPKAPGQTETFTLTGVSSGSDFAFRLLATDDSGNDSDLSNTALGTTDTPPPPPVDTEGPVMIGDLSIAGAGQNWMLVTFTAPADAMGSVVSYDLRRVPGSVFPEGDWSTATVVATDAPKAPGQQESVLVYGLSAETDYAYRVIAFDDVGNAGPFSNVAFDTTAAAPPPPPPDTLGPVTIDDLAVTLLEENAAHLQWTSPVDVDGNTVSYELRYAPGTTLGDAEFGSATLVSTGAPAPAGQIETVTVSGLDPATAYAFRVRATDDSGNPSALSNTATGTTLTPPPPPDTVGPAAVSDLAVIQAGETWLRLRFTAPADAEGIVTDYDLRLVAGANFPGGAWDGATLVTPPLPLSPGSAVEVTVPGLAPGSDYAFRMKSRDDSGNWSGFSNPASAPTLSPPPPPPPPPADTTGPQPVLDLAVAASGETWLLLTFTAPGDEAGTVESYDMRRVSGVDFSEGQWSAATPVIAPVPAAPGTPESVLVEGLPSDSFHAFRLISRDDSDNSSALSNAAAGATLAPPPPPPPPPVVDLSPPLAVTDLAVSVQTGSTVLVTWTAPADSGNGDAVASYVLRWRPDALDQTTWGSASDISPPAPPMQPGGGESLVFDGLPGDGIYAFAVVSTDSAGNVSDLSNVPTVTVDLGPPPDTTPPLPVTGLAAVSKPDCVQLSWNSSPEPDLAHYRVFRARLPGGEYTLVQDGLPDAGFEDGMVVPGRQYSYRVTVVDDAGNESAPSNGVGVRIPHGGGTIDPVEFFSAGNASPNPTREGISIDVAVAEITALSLEVFDVNGRRVRREVIPQVNIGAHRLAWDGRDAHGRPVSRGIYWVRVRTDRDQAVRKVLVTR